MKMLYTIGCRQEFAVAERIQHPNYTGSGFVNDIGLIKLKGRVNVGSEAIGTVEMLKSASFKEKVLNNEKTCWMLGWGLTKYSDGWFETPRMKKLPTRLVSTLPKRVQYLNSFMRFLSKFAFTDVWVIFRLNVKQL